MKIVTLSCNNCGSPLEVPENAKFVTCNHCSSQLAIQRTTSATFTEQVQELGDKQEEMLERLDRIETRGRLADIDRDWERERKQYMITDKHGRTHEPSEVGVIASVAVAIFGVFFAFSARDFGMGAFAGLFVLVAVGMGVYHAIKTKEYRAARRRYSRRRRKALRKPPQSLDDLP